MGRDDSSASERRSVLVTCSSSGLGAAIMVVLMVQVGGFSYRAFNIHLGAMFGSMMAFNVWYRIWPAQQNILAAIKEGTAPDKDLVALDYARANVELIEG